MLLNLQDAELRRAIGKLASMSSVIYTEGEKGLKARIDYMLMTLRHGLLKHRGSDQLYALGISERHQDTCFEMCDGDLVVHGIMTVAIKDTKLESSIRAEGGDMWDRWLATYRKLRAGIPEQSDLF